MYVDGSPPAAAAPRKPRRIRKPHVFGLLFIVLVVLFIVTIGLNPWVLRIGGRTTLNMTWNGYGRVRASNGGSYELYVHMNGGSDRGDCSFSGGCDNLHGTAQLCGSDGVTETYSLTGQVHTWWSTDGARTSLDLTGGSPKPLPSGWIVAFAGSWHGPDLVVANPDNSFTDVFTPAGEIRTTTSTADSGTASVTLAYGSSADFQAACKALAGKAGG